MKRKLWLLLIPVLVTGLCGILSYLAGHSVTWTPLGMPPEPAVEILAASRGAVIVESDSGQSYICTYEIPYSATFLTPYACAWQEIGRSEVFEGVPEKDEYCAYFLPPGRIADRFYVCSSPHWRYVVLTNGSVWTYYRENNFDGLGDAIHYMQLDYCFPVGTAGGILLGITTYGLLSWRRRRTT